MTIPEFLSRLDRVRPRGPGRWSARCPAHADTTPSLSVTEGRKAILLRCWAGCLLPDMCSALGIDQQALFYDQLDMNPQQRRVMAQQRDRKRQKHAREMQRQGRRIDALREAEMFVRSRQGLEIHTWSPEHLNGELNLLADAYWLLEVEGRANG